MITLTLTEDEFNLLTWLFTFGGLVASHGTDEDAKVAAVTARVRATYHHMPEAMDAAEGTLHGKLLAAKVELGSIPPDGIAKLRAVHNEVWGAPDVRSD